MWLPLGITGHIFCIGLLCPWPIWLVVIMNENSLSFDNFSFVKGYSTVGCEVRIFTDWIWFLIFENLSNFPIFLTYKYTHHLMFNVLLHFMAQVLAIEYRSSTLSRCTYERVTPVTRPMKSAHLS